MKNVLLVVILCCLGVFFSGCSSLSRGPSESVRQMLIAPLSDPVTASEWHVRSGTSLELVTWPDGIPGFCGKVTMKKYMGKGEQWPAIIMEGKSLRQRDWSFLKSLHVNIYSEKGGYVRLFLSSRRGKENARFSHDLRLRAGRNALTIPREILKGVHFGEVRSLHFFLTRPVQEQVFYIGDVTGDFEDPVQVVANFSREAEACFGADYSGLPADDKELVREYQEQVKKIQKSLPLDGKMLNSKDIKRGEELMGKLHVLEQVSDFLLLNRQVSLAAGWVSSTEKVYQRSQRFRSKPSARWSFYACGNERESAQLVLLPLQDLKEVHASVELVGLPQVKASIAPVCYVWCEASSIYVPKRSGWLPDPICSYGRSLSLSKGMYQPYYVELQVPAGTPAGTYGGRVRITARDMVPVELPFEVRIFGFDIPSGSPYPLAVARGVTSLGKKFPRTEAERKAYADQCFDILNLHRIAPDSIYRSMPPTAEEARRISASPMGVFNIMYVPMRMDAQGHYPRQEADIIMQTLANAIPEYRKAGILKHAYIYVYDEAGPDKHQSMRDICTRIKKAYPDIPIMTTAYDETFGLASGLDACVDIWVPLSPKLVMNQEAAEAARKRGRQIWWYLCIGPRAPYANLIIDENDAIDGRLFMGIMAQRYRPDGFLYYCAAMWRKYVKTSEGKWKVVSLRDKVMEGAPHTDWLGYSWKDSNGDGNWFYPGAEGPIPSLRLKNMNDGFEDYFYWEMLREAVAQVRTGKVSLDEDWLSAAEQCLKAPERLIISMTQFTKCYEDLQRERIQVGKLLEAYQRQKAK